MLPKVPLLIGKIRARAGLRPRLRTWRSNRMQTPIRSKSAQAMPNGTKPLRACHENRDLHINKHQALGRRSPSGRSRSLSTIGRSLARSGICRAEIAGESGSGTRCVHDQFVGDLPCDRHALLDNDRRTQYQPIVARRRCDVGSPRRPHQGKAMTKQKTVAGIRGGGQIIAGRRFVQLTENGDIAAVTDLVQKRAVRRVTSAGRNTRDDLLYLHNGHRCWGDP
jgi:hypothetical protein